MRLFQKHWGSKLKRQIISGSVYVENSEFLGYNVLAKHKGTAFMFSQNIIFSRGGK
jgi:hypothetical protein